MKKFLTIVFVLLLATFIASAQKTPAFANYPAKVTTTQCKPPNLASKHARMYRTNLRDTAKKGVNFAGHFVVSEWGCGTSCLEAGIIDARTGKVFFPTILQGVGAGFCELPVDAETLAYKPDSRLLVLSGFKGGAQNDSYGRCGIYYFEWTGANFRQIKFIPKKSTM